MAQNQVKCMNNSSSKKHGYDLECVLCGHTNDEQITNTYCVKCGGVLEVNYHQPSETMPLPISGAEADPLKVHPTPLVRLNRLSEQYGAELFAKLEFEHITGCFKDRGSFVEVQKAIELGRDAICVASTGNMAASVAAYAGYYKMPCFVFVPEKTPDVKVAQATIYGANIIKIKGDFNQCEQLCREFSKSGNYYLAGDYVFRQEGQKSCTYELAEQQTEPFDYILIPVGAGTNFAAIFKGFRELKASGKVNHIPSFVAVQPEQSSPVVEGIFKKEKIIKKTVNTMAEAVAVSDPFDFHKVLRGINETNGHAFTVTENEILDSLREMAMEEGYFTETACALPLAALKNNRELFRNKRCLLLLTGNGLKSTHIVAKHALTSPVLNPDIKQINKYVESGYMDMQKEAWGKARDTYIANLNLDQDHQRLYEQYIKQIRMKGKMLSNAEMETLQTLVFNEDTDLEYPVTVEDYKVIMQRNDLVEAVIKLNIRGHSKTSRASGVGPVDSLLTAVKRVVDDLICLDIINHQVEILSPDIDSLVVVSLEIDFRGDQWVVKAASPDTLEAALDAFLKGVAMAYKKARDN